MNLSSGTLAKLPLSCHTVGNSLTTVLSCCATSEVPYTVTPFDRRVSRLDDTAVSAAADTRILFSVERIEWRFSGRAAR